MDTSELLRPAIRLEDKARESHKANKTPKEEQMPETIKLSTNYDGHCFDTEAVPMTETIEEIVIAIAYAVAAYVRAIVPTMSDRDEMLLVSTVRELLPKEGGWRPCIYAFFEDCPVVDAMRYLDTEGSFFSESDLRGDALCSGRNYTDVAIAWRRSRAWFIVRDAKANTKAIDEMPKRYFVNGLWWETVADRLRDQGESVTADALLQDPYYGVLREEQKLIMAVSKAAGHTVFI